MQAIPRPAAGDPASSLQLGMMRRREAWIAALPPMLFGLSLSAPYVPELVRGQIVIGGVPPRSASCRMPERC